MIDLLIVAGAGASHKLGVGDSALPLMGHWAETLCRQLDAEESGLADACGLDQEFDGEAFEIALGQVLEWDQARSLEEKFEPLALNNFNGPPKEKSVMHGETPKIVSSSSNAPSMTLFTCSSASTRWMIRRRRLHTDPS